MIESEGELRLVSTFRSFNPFGWSWACQYFDLEDARKLRKFIDESERIVADLPPSTDDMRTGVIVKAFLVALVIVGLAILPAGGFTILGTAVILVNCIHQIRVFRRFDETRVYATVLMSTLALCVLTIACIKMALVVGS